jgi:hypothetical protein
VNRCLIAPDGGAVLCWRNGGKVQQLHRNGNGKYNGNGHPHRDPPRAKPPKDGRTFASPELATAAAQAQVGTGATLTSAWAYQVPGGAECMQVLRFDLPDGSKSFRPIHPHKGGWRIGDPQGPLPLYRMIELTPDAVVFATEGEKACDAAASIGLTATTSAHGSAAADKSDWTPLAGRDVVILPDHDDAGAKYARDVARLLLKLEPPARVKVVQLPGLPDGGDVVEFIEAGGTREDIETLAKAAKLIDVSDVCGGPVLVRMDKVTRRRIEWLWPSRIPIGRLTLLAGEQGAGKSFLTTDITARVTTGSPWPNTVSPAPRGDVLMIAAEDDEGDTVGPRLDSAHADCSKVHLLTIIRRIDPETGKAAECCFTLADVSSLEAALQQMPDCKLVSSTQSAHSSAGEWTRTGTTKCGPCSDPSLPSPRNTAPPCSWSRTFVRRLPHARTMPYSAAVSSPASRGPYGT